MTTSTNETNDHTPPNENDEDREPEPATPGIYVTFWIVSVTGIMLLVLVGLVLLAYFLG